MTTEKKRTDIRDKAWYEQRGLCRHMLVLPIATRDQLQQIADLHGITPSAVVEELLTSVYQAAYTPRLIERGKQSAAAGNGRGRPPKNTSKAKVNKLVKNLTPEQLEKAQAYLASLE